MIISEQAKQIYNTKFKSALETTDRDRFVAIEPASESYFLRDGFPATVLASKQAYPDRKSFVIRISHEAAFR